MLVDLCIASLFALYILAIFRGRFWNPIVDSPEKAPPHWPDVDIVIPARNEAEILPETLPELLAQDYPGHYRIILVDDRSDDGTATTARRLAKGKEQKLEIVSPSELPEGWTGKVAAMQAGAEKSTAPYILFTDADIEHPPYSLRQLVARAEKNAYDLTSLMVMLNHASLAEKFFIPAFVFFFMMLYPFRKVNDPASNAAGAAGGVMLVRRKTLDEAGGLAAIKDALIDDCSLAKIIKKAGGKISLTLTKDVHSLRRYFSVIDIHDMVARSAYTQLKHSAPLMALTILALFIVFVAPVLAFFTFDMQLMFLGGIAWFVMGALYAPTVLFYGLPLFWAATLPLAAIFYMIATFNSARRSWAGEGGLWKGRVENHAKN